MLVLSTCCKYSNIFLWYMYMYKEQTTITYVSLSLTVAPFLYSLSLLKIEYYLSQNW